VFRHKLESAHTQLAVQTLLSKVKDFSRYQAVTYTGLVVISRKRC